MQANFIIFFVYVMPRLQVEKKAGFLKPVSKSN